MIEADFNYPQSVHMQQTSRPKQAFISYEDFFSQYWPHFPQPLTKGLGKIWTHFHLNTIY